MNTTILIQYLDQLREERNISQEHFIDTIVSNRQYSRYKKGVNDVPFEVIIKLTDKLNLSLSDVITSFEQTINNESVEVKNFFNQVARKNIDEAKKLNNRLKERQFIRKPLYTYYKIASLMLMRLEKVIDETAFVDQIKSAIKFPSVLEKTTLSDQEVYALGLIMQNDTTQISCILDKLLALDKAEKIISFDDVYVKLRNRFFIVKNLGRLKRYQELIAYAERTIDYASTYHMHYTLDLIYYCKALAHYYLKEQDAFEEALKASILEVLRKPKSAHKPFFTMVKKDTDVDAEAFIKHHIVA